MKTSDSIGKIGSALAKARAEMGRIVRDKTAKVQTKSGGSYSFDYADLASVLDVVTPALAKQEVAVIQAAALEGDKVAVETRLVHSSGEWIESVLAVKPEDVAPQKIGGAITYARRYALSAMVGVASEEDDDGNAASGNKAETKHRNGGGDAERKAEHDAKVREMRAKVSDPAARLKAVEAFLARRFGEGEVRSRIEKVIGRTFGAGNNVEVTEEELGKLEQAQALTEAHSRPN